MQRQPARSGKRSINLPSPDSTPGALVISLDFELAWGVFDTLGTEGPYKSNLLGAREVIPRILELFDSFNVAATWATVGFLFAETAEEKEWFSPPPELRPSYSDVRLDPYRVTVGANERTDPLHFAPSLIRLISETPRQEVASHTFSHYVALEPGQGFPSFAADLEAAIAIAKSHGHDLRTLVMPRHQSRPDYFPAYRSAGFTVHRGNEPNRLNLPERGGQTPIWVRGARLLDSYLNVTGPSTFSWEQMAVRDGLQDVPESRFFRPPMTRHALIENLRIRRITGAMETAAKLGQVYHLWWHPHNFGLHQGHQLAQLERVLRAYRTLQQDYGMLSLNMAEAASMAALGQG